MVCGCTYDVRKVHSFIRSFVRTKCRKKVGMEFGICDRGAYICIYIHIRRLLKLGVYVMRTWIFSKMKIFFFFLPLSTFIYEYLVDALSPIASSDD